TRHRDSSYHSLGGPCNARGGADLPCLEETRGRAESDGRGSRRTSCRSLADRRAQKNGFRGREVQCQGYGFDRTRNASYQRDGGEDVSPSGESRLGLGPTDEIRDRAASEPGTKNAMAAGGARDWKCEEDSLCNPYSAVLQARRLKRGKEFATWVEKGGSDGAQRIRNRPKRKVCRTIGGGCD